MQLRISKNIACPTDMQGKSFAAKNTEKHCVPDCTRPEEARLVHARHESETAELIHTEDVQGKHLAASNIRASNMQGNAFAVRNIAYQRA